MEEKTATRWHFLDTLRASLMLLGIPFHAADPFREDSLFLDLVFGFTHLWRMETFFVLAGFFAMVMIARQGPRVWWRGRLRRLGIPLMTFVLLSTLR